MSYCSEDVLKHNTDTLRSHFPLQKLICFQEKISSFRASLCWKVRREENLFYCEMHSDCISPNKNSSCLGITLHQPSTQLHPPTPSSTQVHSPPPNSNHLHLADFNLHQFYPLPASSFHPPPNSLRHPQQYLNKNIARNWAISPNIDQKFESYPFWLNISTHGILEVLITNPDLEF